MAAKRKEFTVEQYLSPSKKDIEYMQPDQLKISLICRMDSYKFAHPFAYRKGIQAMSAHMLARVKSHVTIIPAGMQLLTKKYLTQRITMADVDAAEQFAIGHFGRKLFARDSWEGVVNEHGGAIPIIIRAVPEGTRIRGGQPLYSVTAFGELYYWMSTAFETLLQRGIWYPTTIATMDYDIKNDIRMFYEDTGADMAMLPFALHDFGARGVTAPEQAEIGGFAHTIGFMGSDNIEGILTANFYYKCAMSAFSVYATEHSVECSFGLGSEDEVEYIRHQLRQAPAGSIVSIVIDGKDTYRATEAICTTLRDEVIACKAKVVLRPDSGDMQEIVPRLLRRLDQAFGHVVNKKGFKKINYVGILQGDGVDHLAIRSLLGNIMSRGYSADNVIFGSGGALLQKVNRDTYKFAQKASAMMVDGKWIGLAKDPITDKGKKSEEGVLTLLRSRMTGELMTGRLDDGPFDTEWEDVHQLVYHCGRLFNETTLDEVRNRVEALGNY